MIFAFYLNQFMDPQFKARVIWCHHNLPDVQSPWRTGRARSAVDHLATVDGADHSVHLGGPFVGLDLHDLGHHRASGEGGVIFGLNAALREEITIAEGRVEQTSFADYSALRTGAAPRVVIHLVENHGGSGGIAICRYPGPN